MKQHVFIAGTDAGVGKSYVINALLNSLREEGVRAIGYKPVACGDRTEARAMREAMQQPTLSLDLMNPLYLRAVADPLMAASLERKEVDVDALVYSWQQIAQQYELVLTEGCYGWGTPLAPGLSMADLAQKLNLPVVLVALNQKGAAALISLTLADIKARGLHCAGVILNHPSEEWDTAAVTNAELIEQVCGVPVLASLINGDELSADILDI